MGRWCLLWLLCGCRINFDEVVDAGAGSGGEGAVDSAPLGPWTLAPTPLYQTAGAEEDPTMSSSLLELVFTDTAAGGELQSVTRTGTGGGWSGPMILSVNGTGTTEAEPRLSADDQTLYFGSNRAGGQGSRDIWFATRMVGGGWSTPVNLIAVNTAAVQKWFSPCTGGRYVLVTNPTPNEDILEGVIGGAPAAPISIVNSPTAMDSGSHLSADCLTLHFFSTRGGGDRDIFVATRTDVLAPWSAPQPVDELNTAGDDEDPWMSPDGHTIIISSNRAGTKDIYIATR